MGVSVENVVAEQEIAHVLGLEQRHQLGRCAEVQHQRDRFDRELRRTEQRDVRVRRRQARQVVP